MPYSDLLGSIGMSHKITEPMKVKISDIEFEISSQPDEFGDGQLVTFSPVGDHDLVNKHQNYFKYSAQVNQKSGLINFIGLDLDSGHYANGWFKTNSLKSGPLLWFWFMMREFKDYLFLQTEYNKYQFTKGSNIKFLLTNNSILDINSEFDPTESLIYGKVKLSCYPYNLTQDEIELFKSEKFKKWKYTNNTMSFEGGRTIAHPLGIEENIIVAANIYDYLVKQYFPDHKRIKEREDRKETAIQENCSLYIMKDLSNGYYKIGISNNPEYRERTLQSEKPTIELLESKEFASRKLATAIESAIHSAYQQHRLRGEWFDLKSQHLDEILELFK